MAFEDLSPDERELARRSRHLGELLFETMSDTFRFYRELAPEARELTPLEAEAVRERLEAVAQCGRAADRERDLLTSLAEDYDTSTHGRRRPEHAAEPPARAVR